MGWWNLGAWRAPAVSEEEAGRMQRKCGRTFSALVSCRRANGGDKDNKNCKNLQDRYCLASVVCCEEAATYDSCVRRVVNSKGKEAFSACDGAMRKIEACLKRKRVSME
ncbi:LOW QUALITY PROTEIN: hypothetical protein PSENEW3n2_00002300 [Picochlorum sp. SENEW3]|nr:LOW QUALITY PROTEIN: hypothetical protein PSENEW3n2_00002300 [Picochlorum sp. SENEW3]WPT15937.1 LOW QUALITY PROTEIN: hypothetical protein PSENEW3_00002300 [Picochlorum sp. SENEW3]